MKWYKRDPHAALEGMAELTLEERGAYNTILDLLYSRDGIVRDEDWAIARRMNVQVRRWLPIKSRLIDKGKIWVVDGYVEAKRVAHVIEMASKQSVNQSKTASKRWFQEKNLRKNKGSPEIWQYHVALPNQIERKNLSSSNSESMTAHEEVADKKSGNGMVTPELVSNIKRRGWSDGSNSP